VNGHCKHIVHMMRYPTIENICEPKVNPSTRDSERVDLRYLASSNNRVVSNSSSSAQQRQNGDKKTAKDVRVISFHN
jgi:hypothetical protein